MASNKKKLNISKRLDCLKKKTKELSTLCDIDALFLCKQEDDSSSNSFESWPEDRTACLSLIQKYKNSCVPAKSSTHSVVLGKRKERSEGDHAQTEFCRDFQQNKKSQASPLDGVDFHFFYSDCFESILENQFLCNTQMELCQNLQESKSFQMGFLDGIDFDEFFCKPIQENGDFCNNAPEVEGLETGLLNGFDFDEVCANFCKQVGENESSRNQMVLCEDIQETEDFGELLLARELQECPKSDMGDIINQLKQKDLIRLLTRVDDCINLVSQRIQMLQQW